MGDALVALGLREGLYRLSLLGVKLLVGTLVRTSAKLRLLGCYEVVDRVLCDLGPVGHNDVRLALLLDGVVRSAGCVHLVDCDLELGELFVGDARLASQLLDHVAVLTEHLRVGFGGVMALLDGTGKLRLSLGQLLYGEGSLEGEVAVCVQPVSRGDSRPAGHRLGESRGRVTQVDGVLVSLLEDMDEGHHASNGGCYPEANEGVLEDARSRGGESALLVHLVVVVAEFLGRAGSREGHVGCGPKRLGVVLRALDGLRPRHALQRLGLHKVAEDVLHGVDCDSRGA